MSPPYLAKEPLIHAELEGRVLGVWRNLPTTEALAGDLYLYSPQNAVAAPDGDTKMLAGPRNLKAFRMRPWTTTKNGG